jgi:hypothetical protein
LALFIFNEIKTLEDFIYFDFKDLGNIFINWKNIFLFYLAFSIALSAIPSDQDGKTFGDYIKKRVKKNFLFFPIFIFFPLVWVLNLFNFLKKYYFDYFFAFLLFYL